MPYIKQDERAAFDEHIFALVDEIHTVGQLNYVVSKLAASIVNDGATNYEQLNAVDGALGLAHAEFRRRWVFPYEDKAIERNGDLFDSTA